MINKRKEEIISSDKEKKQSSLAKISSKEKITWAVPLVRYSGPLFDKG